MCPASKKQRGLPGFHRKGEHEVIDPLCGRLYADTLLIFFKKQFCRTVVSFIVVEILVKAAVAVGGRIDILSPPSPLGEEAAAPLERKGTGAKSQSAVEIYREIIKDNIEYEHLCQYAKGIDRDMLDEIVDLLVETVCSARKTIRIAGDDYPAELVKSKLMKLNSSHIEFVFDCISKNTTEIRNIKKYLLAVLFNAPSTINGYYTALVAHDMNTGSWGTPQNR